MRVPWPSYCLCRNHFSTGCFPALNGSVFPHSLLREDPQEMPHFCTCFRRLLKHVRRLDLYPVVLKGGIYQILGLHNLLAHGLSQGNCDLAVVQWISCDESTDRLPNIVCSKMQPIAIHDIVYPLAFFSVPQSQAIGNPLLISSTVNLTCRSSRILGAASRRSTLTECPFFNCFFSFLTSFDVSFRVRHWQLNLGLYGRVAHLTDIAPAVQLVIDCQDYKSLVVACQ